MLMNETFHRCKSCNEPYFLEKRKVLLSKDSVGLNLEPFVEKEFLEYVCASCGTLASQVTRKNERVSN